MKSILLTMSFVSVLSVFSNKQAVRTRAPHEVAEYLQQVDLDSENVA